MMNVGIRVNVSDEIHRLLCEEQRKRKSASGKQTSLSSLVSEYFTFGLQDNIAGLGQNAENCDQNAVLLSTTIQVQQKAMELAQREKQLQLREDRIRHLENEQRSTDNDIRNREQELSQAYDELCEKKIDFSDEKEKLLVKVAENTSNKATIERLYIEIQKRDIESLSLKNDFMKTQSDILKEFDKVNKKLDNKPDKNVWKDWIAPFMPVASDIVTTLITNKNINSLKDIEPQINELIQKFNSIAPAQKQQIIQGLASTFGGVQDTIC
ncbi:MAG: hypothetical protein WCM76_06630 [Bacteroidota bacterium]